MGENKLLSILVLSYNNTQYYKDCIKSILEQSYSNIEIVISDDGSKKFDEKELTKFINENKKENITNVVINRNEKNVGIVKNYNIAIKKAKGEYFFYLAMDDAFYDKDVAKDVVDYFEKSGYDIFTGYRMSYDENLKIAKNKLPIEDEAKFIIKATAKEMHEAFLNKCYIAGCSTPFSRKLIEKFGMLNEEYFYLEDYARYAEITGKGCKIGFLDRILVKYRNGGITGDVANLSNNYIKDLKLMYSKEFNKKIKNDFSKYKTIVGWGTSVGFTETIRKIDVELDFLVDSSKEKQNTSINKYNIYSPEVLKNLDKESTFIMVFSSTYYFEITKQLKEYGFEEWKNFRAYTPLNIVPLNL